ncbi:type II toxin-antitoxin system death-on-curing family toxin [Spirosoma daeguense]
MITLEEVLAIHQVLIEEFGGASGVRDETILLSALQRPYSGFGAVEFYPEIGQKAAAILESIVTGHPFVDGNKRTGYVLMRLLLLEQGKDILAGQNEKYTFVIDVATGVLSFEQIVNWVKQNTG